MNTAQLDDVTVVVPAYNEEGRIGPVVRELTDLYSNFSIRLFHSGFAVLLYDLWLLVDFLVQTLIDVVEFRTNTGSEDIENTSEIEAKMDVSRSR